jgi:predicted nucleotidyltransferase
MGALVRQSELEEIISVLRANQPELIQRGVKDIAIFGSVARGTASASSDVDILVEFSQPIGLFEFIRLKMLLEQWLEKKVDLVTPDALHPALRQRILNEAMYVR